MSLVSEPPVRQRALSLVSESEQSSGPDLGLCSLDERVGAALGALSFYDVATDRVTVREAKRNEAPGLLIEMSDVSITD
ncbi:hypothetical protein ACQEVM_37270 [Streptomyces sp. CA-243310]|uniref:hypothetical protein n=1 Tax=Streptomyces sp. CA-243310 TaxID=3240056 RepID=UPI003D931376